VKQANNAKESINFRTHSCLWRAIIRSLSIRIHSYYKQWPKTLSPRQEFHALSSESREGGEGSEGRRNPRWTWGTSLPSLTSREILRCGSAALGPFVVKQRSGR
jgi:hypothetical protein